MKEYLQIAVTIFCAMLGFLGFLLLMALVIPWLEGIMPIYTRWVNGFFR